jgi:hypothetical protein
MGKISKAKPSTPVNSLIADVTDRVKLRKFKVQVWLRKG